MTATVVAAVDDFFFQTKIKEAARAVGIEMVFEPTIEGAVAAIQKRNARLLIIDLDTKAFAPAELLAAASGVKTVGYLPHVRGDLRKAAEAAGCGLVLPRSAFVKRLASLLEEARDAGR